MLLLVILFSLPFIFLVLKKHTRNRQHTVWPPGPPGLPLIGNLHQLANTTLHHHLHRLSKSYGPLMSLRLGSVQTLVISSPAMAKEVMKTYDLQFCSRPTMLGQKKLSYNQLDIAFSPYNKYWREIRKICILHLFSSKNVQSFRACREEEVCQMMKKIETLAVSSIQPINLSELAMSLTSIITCRSSFGKRYDEDFKSLLSETQTVLGSFFVSDYFPVLGWVDRVSGMCAKLERTFKKLDSFYQELIDEHLNANRPESMKGDIIDILLGLQKDPSTPIHLTMDHIKAVLMNIFLAGTDTSAALIVWAMTALIKHPQSLKKVQGEVRNSVPGKKGFLDEDDVGKLHYLKNVIKETLRLYPPGPLLIPRETIEKCKIGGFEVEPRTMVYINAWAIQRDPEAWDNAEEFLPERFFGSDIDFRGQDFEFIPFGAGRRGCPGINLGISTVEIALANLIYRFDWDLPGNMKKEDVDTEVMPGIAMQKKNALCLTANIYSL